MKFPLFIIGLFIVLCSCSTPSPEQKIITSRFSVICPHGWIIMENDSVFSMDNLIMKRYDRKIGSGSYGAIYMKKEGRNESGVFSLTSVDGLMDLNEKILSYMDIMPKAFKNEIEFEKIENSDYNVAESRLLKYRGKIKRHKFQGEVHVFYKNNRTVIILKQEEEKGTDGNAEGYRVIEESLVFH